MGIWVNIFSFAQGLSYVISTYKKSHPLIFQKKKKNYPLFYLTFYYNIVIQVLEIVRFYNHTRSSQMQRENLVLLLIPIINYPPTTINNQNSETSVKIHVQACFLAHLFAAGQTISSSSLSGSFV